MDNAEIKEYLLDFQKKELPELIERELVLDESAKITSIIGPRRAGKTYVLYQKIKHLVNSGVKKENIVYLNFEDPRLIGVTFKQVRDVIKLHWQIFPSSINAKLYVFIDEPQNIKNWEISVRALHDEGFRIFLSGSSSKLLSKEIATSLRGRTIAHILLPLSFKEFLRLKGVSFDLSKLSSREKSALLSLVDEYLEFGGFPEIAQEGDKENKARIINEYFNSVVYKDVIERYKIENTQLIKWLIKVLISSFSREFSIHKLYLTLKSQGFALSKNTLYSYSAMLEDAMFIFQVGKFNHAIRKKELTIPKVYLADLGFTKLAQASKDIGYKIENTVFLELERRKKTLTEISYWKNVQQEEVDFVVRQGAKVQKLVQACAYITNRDTKKRELRGLIKASRELKCKNLLIITYDYEAEEKIKNKKVRYVPLWKWLLQ